MAPRVATHGAALSRELARIFNVPWSPFPIRVDVSVYSSWAGAYTTLYPDRITVAWKDTMYANMSGLEMLFHEAMHTMDDSVRRA